MSGYQKFVISGFHIARLLKSAPGKTKISLNLGITTEEVIKSGEDLLFPDGQRIKLSTLQTANKKRHNEDCFLIENDTLFYLYSFENSRAYKLYEPHIDWPPTLWINGSVMHAVSVSKPTEEAENKVKALGHVSGKVFDTCFGLGYTSIELVKKGAAKVYTCESSKSVIEIAEVNPWSIEAFKNKKINLENIDVIKAIMKIDDNKFDLILHDPPNVKIEGDLYSLNFYKELYRVLKRGGTLYHFVGGGRVPHEYKVDYTKGAINRLLEAGFRKVSKSYRGIVAYK